MVVYAGYVASWVHRVVYAGYVASWVYNGVYAGYVASLGVCLTVVYMPGM